MISTKNRLILISVTIAIFVAMLFGGVGLFLINNNWDKVSANYNLVGEGTSESPYLISCAEDLKFVAENINNSKSNKYNSKYYKQTQRDMTLVALEQEYLDS